MDNLERIAKRWNAIKTDKDRWKYLLSHKKEIGLLLENDETYACLCKGIIPAEEDWDSLPEMNNFDAWIGNDHGLNVLFEVLGIEAEAV